MLQKVSYQGLHFLTLIRQFLDTLRASKMDFFQILH